MSTPIVSSPLSSTCQSKSESLSSNNESVDNPSLDSHVKDKLIRASFEKYKYSPVSDSPIILDIKNSEVYFNKDGPDQDEFKALEDEDWNKVLTEKLETHGFGEYNLTVSIISAKHFKSRDKMEELTLHEWNCGLIDSEFIPFTTKDVFFDQIPFKKALKDVFDLRISCNMGYYKNHLDEMEKDSGCNFESMDLSLEGLKKLKNRLLFKLSLEIFGDIHDMEEKAKSTVIFRDFHLLHDDGNQKFATARRGDRYLLFSYLAT